MITSMLTTRWRTLAAACATAGVLVLTAAGWAGETTASTPPLTAVPIVELTAPEVAEVLVRARVDGDWVTYADVATGGALDEAELQAAARSAAVDLGWGMDPGAELDLVAAWDEAGTTIVWVRAVGAEVHTWELQLARMGGAWRLVGVDRDPGGQPVPAAG